LLGEISHTIPTRKVGPNEKRRREGYIHNLLFEEMLEEISEEEGGGGDEEVVGDGC